MGVIEPGENAVQFFTIEFKDDSSDGPDEVLGELDGDNVADLKDVVLGLKALAGNRSACSTASRTLSRT